MITDLLKEEDTVIAFDLDGVLAKIEWDKYNHFLYNDVEWQNACEEGKVEYGEKNVIKKMQAFLETKDMSRIFVVTRVNSDIEVELKRDFVSKYYNIPRENLFEVRHNAEKVERLFEIKEKFPELPNYKLVMVDDTVMVLNSIWLNSDFSTAHISSFLDI